MYNLDRLDDICEQELSDSEILSSNNTLDELPDNPNSPFYFVVNLETGDMGIKYR